MISSAVGDMGAGEIRVGTSGWHYPGGAGTWNGPFYPLKRPRGFDELRFYAEHFSTVEVNATFYRPPDAALSRKWLDRTPDAFLFAIKLYQKFTHPEMYAARAPGDWDVNLGDLDQFRAGIDPIATAGRLGALLIQFPSSFHATEAARDYVSWLLDAFAAYPRAVEFRHASWTGPESDTVPRLDAAGAALVEIDEPFAHFRGATPAAARTRAPLSYIRLHGRNTAEWWHHAQAEDRYNYLYRAEELAPIANAAQAEAALEKRVLVYFNNHFSAKAVANADILKNQIGELAPGWQLRP